MYLQINEYEGVNEYAEITNRDGSEASDYRVEMASRLLDSRVGYYVPDETTGYKLDLTELSVHQSRAVKIWVAWMIAYLATHNDMPPTAESITLGRFSVSQGQGNDNFPDQMSFADSLIASSGLVNRKVAT
jgi:hypothetical protein